MSMSRTTMNAMITLRGTFKQIRSGAARSNLKGCERQGLLGLRQGYSPDWSTLSP